MPAGFHVGHSIRSGGSMRRRPLGSHVAGVTGQAAGHSWGARARCTTWTRPSCQWTQHKRYWDWQLATWRGRLCGRGAVAQARDWLEIFDGSSADAVRVGARVVGARDCGSPDCSLCLGVGTRGPDPRHDRSRDSLKKRVL